MLLIVKNEGCGMVIKKFLLINIFENIDQYWKYCLKIDTRLNWKINFSKIILIIENEAFSNRKNDNIIEWIDN